jgi:hypothetical protein
MKNRQCRWYVCFGVLLICWRGSLHITQKRNLKAVIHSNLPFHSVYLSINANTNVPGLIAVPDATPWVTTSSMSIALQTWETVRPGISPLEKLSKTQHSAVTIRSCDNSAVLQNSPNRHVLISTLITADAMVTTPTVAKLQAISRSVASISSATPLRREAMHRYAALRTRNR